MSGPRAQGASVAEYRARDFLRPSTFHEDTAKEPHPSSASMLPEITEISRLRRALGVSQVRLASLSGVSQSAIAKIERGRVSPSYRAVKLLLDALELERSRHESKAILSDVQSRRVIAIDPAMTLEQAVSQLRHHQFSQAPVIDGHRHVGSLSERTISNLVMTGRNPSDLSRMRVRQVMEPPLPVLDEGTPVPLAAELLQHYAAVLVTARGEVKGIVTKSDLLKLVRVR